MVFLVFNRSDKTSCLNWTHYWTQKSFWILFFFFCVLQMLSKRSYMLTWCHEVYIEISLSELPCVIYLSGFNESFQHGERNTVIWLNQIKNLKIIFVYFLISSVFRNSLPSSRCICRVCDCTCPSYLPWFNLFNEWINQYVLQIHSIYRERKYAFRHFWFWYLI